MGRYAQGTEVASDRSRAEIERTLERYGADSFYYATQPGRATIGCRMRGRILKISVPLPAASEFALTPTRQQRTERQQQELREQEVRRRWRVLALVIKATFEAIESGVLDFDTALLGWLMLPDGSTMGEWARPQIEAAYDAKQMPPLLPGVVA